MKRVSLIILIVMPATGFVTSPLIAQGHSPVVFQATIGSHTVSGGTIDNRTGLLLDVLAAVPVRTMPARSIVIAAGGSGVFGGSGDRCLITPSGGCAGKGNFGVVNALVGVEQAVDSVPVRLLIGPAMYDGANARSVGVQARIDLFAPVSRHTVVGIMVRATALPSHGGQSLTAWAGGFTLGFR